MCIIGLMLMFVVCLLNNTYKNHYLISELGINYLADSLYVKTKKNHPIGWFFCENSLT